MVSVVHWLRRWTNFAVMLQLNSEKNGSDWWQKRWRLIVWRCEDHRKMRRLWSWYTMVPLMSDFLVRQHSFIHCTFMRPCQINPQISSVPVQCTLKSHVSAFEAWCMARRCTGTGTGREGFWCYSASDGNVCFWEIVIHICRIVFTVSPHFLKYYSELCLRIRML